MEIFYFDKILIEEKPYESILVYKISYKTLTDAKPLHIRFDKVSGYIRFYDGTRYLVLFSPEKYNSIYNRIRYLISQKVVLHMFFLIIMQESKLIDMVLYL